MSIFKKVTCLGLISFFCSCQKNGTITPSQDNPLYFFSEETQSYTEVLFLEDAVVVFNERGYV